MTIGSKELIRGINTQLVLETIIEKSPISRAELSKELGLTKATISSIVSELLSRSLVAEIGCGETTIGRKPTLLCFEQAAAAGLAVDLTVDSIHYLLTDLGGNAILKQSAALQDGYEQNVLQLLTEVVDHCIQCTNYMPYGLIGITISIHGVTYHNQIIFTPYYDLYSADIAKNLQERYNIPVRLYNDSNLAVMGENIFSVQVPNIASIYVYSGIGLGLIFNHRLYEGANGYAGEFGHTIIELGGRQCPCGNAGCLEQYASQRALLNELANRKNVLKISFEEYVSLYESGDNDAIYITRQFVTFMAAGINNLLNLYNPEVVLLNSRFTAQFPEILDEIKQNLLPRAEITDSLRLSKMNGDAILYGGAYINIMQFLKIKHFKPKLRF